MKSFIEDGTVVAIQLRDEKEIFGEWKGIVWDYEETLSDGISTAEVRGECASKYIKIGRTCQVVTTHIQTQGGIIPQKTLIKVAENGAFLDEVLVKETNILLIKTLVAGSGLYNLFLQATTGLPTPGGGNTPGTPGIPPAMGGIGLSS